MIGGLYTGWRGLRHFFSQSYVYIWANVLWFLLTLPVITAPAAWAGLCQMSYYAYRQPTAQLEHFWQGFRTYWKSGMVIGVTGLLLIIMTTVNFIGFRNEIGIAAYALRFLWLFILVGWFGIQLYAFPLLSAMQTPSLRGAYRNAVVMFLRNPFYTLGVWLFCVPVVIFSLFFPAAWLLVTGSALAAIGNAAVLDRLVAAGIQKPPEVETAESTMFDESY